MVGFYFSKYRCQTQNPRRASQELAQMAERAVPDWSLNPTG
jgi:hypothetical protein